MRIWLTRKEVGEYRYAIAVILVFLGTLYASAFLPGPVSGSYDINFGCGCDGFHFYRVSANHVWIVSTTHEPPQYIGTVTKTNGVWRVPFNPLYKVSYSAKPGLFWIDVWDQDDEQPTRLWRRPQFWRVWPLLHKHSDFMRQPPPKRKAQ